MSERFLSYAQVVQLVFDDSDVRTALVDVVEQHKNWGQYTVRIPSWVLVNLLDAYKALAEQQLGSRVPVTVEEESDAGA